MVFNSQSKPFTSKSIVVYSLHTFSFKISKIRSVLGYKFIYKLVRKMHLHLRKDSIYVLNIIKLITFLVKVS